MADSPLENLILEKYGSVQYFLDENYYPYNCNLRSAADLIGYDKRTLHAYLVRKGYPRKSQSECQSGELNGFAGHNHTDYAKKAIGESSAARQPVMVKSVINGRFGQDYTDYRGSDSPVYKDGIGTYRQETLTERGSVCERCGKCGEGRFINVHHEDENRRNNSTDNLTVLCVSCHRREHSSRKKGGYEHDIKARFSDNSPSS